MMCRHVATMPLPFSLSLPYRAMMTYPTPCTTGLVVVYSHSLLFFFLLAWLDDMFTNFFVGYWVRTNLLHIAAIECSVVAIRLLSLRRGFDVCYTFLPPVTLDDPERIAQSSGSMESHAYAVLSRTTGRTKQWLGTYLPLG
ncbi:hypothetical protein B0H63DRAFT_319746 [Podospora didyma]|uniref:Uncharacterized protein n=1 Tax=Podospora didyma TaxID=330526 RepID=A0AAE0K6E6_9PEZI|nr:hypothetical protein B0H63DRAFT_319746 [Podospora didyma]